MKQEDITLRIDSNLKDDFKTICDIENTTMSNKIHEFINEEIKIKKKITIESNIHKMLEILGWSNIYIIDKPVQFISGCMMQVSDFNLSSEFTFIDFLNQNKNKDIYLYLLGSSFTDKIRAFIIG
jgi:hypothetical protein